MKRRHAASPGGRQGWGKAAPSTRFHTDSLAHHDPLRHPCHDGAEVRPHLNDNKGICMLALDTIKVQVVYGDALVAAGLTATLRDQRDIALIGCSLHDGGVSAAGPHGSVNVIVSDYEHGLAILARARISSTFRQCGLPAVLIVSQRDTESEIRHALEQGVRGFVLLGCRVDELVDGVRALRAGLRHIDARAAQRLADSVACEALTGREQAVLRLLVEGLGNKAIANRLGIAIGTVKSHLKAIFQKLHAGSRTEVATVAERRGLLTVAGVAASRHDEVPSHTLRDNRPRSTELRMSEARVLAAH